MVEAPPGTPYHRLARTPAQRWWRPIAGTVAILLSGLAAIVPIMVAWVLVESLTSGVSVVRVAEVAGEADGPLLRDSNAELGFTLVSVAVFLPFILLAAWAFQRRRPGSLSSVTGRLRWRWLLVCAGLSVLTSLVSFGCAWLASLLVDRPAPEEGAWVGWGAFAVPLLIVVLLVPFQATAEEYFFRGWLLQSIGGCTLETRTGRVARALSPVFRTPWPAICIGGLAFVSVHGYTGWGMVAIFGFAAITGWLTVRTGGLEAAIAIHVVNNVVAFLLPAAVGQLSLEQGDIPWPYVLADLAPLLLYAALVARLARRRELETVSPPAAGPVPVAA
ncbi:CAAX protease self-immunity [Thermomonospora echinospora]|uniref:CAAX protease self-immunity n=1 Tax=Thermomonospora echinospora TaxID=1992 RepID=A0A1H6A082_9ACTN|nr:CAAX protease self-immunity [Thermomonospora echinospora]